MELTLHTTFPEEIGAEWNDLLDHTAAHVPFLRHEYQRVWWRTRGGGEWPQAELAMVTARKEGRLVGIAPLFKSLWKGRSALLLLGSIEVSDYLDFLVRPEDLEGFLDALLPFLVEQVGWEALDLYNFLDDSPTLPALKAASEKLGWSFEQETVEHAPFISLPQDWETYLAGVKKKQRHEIRRKLRRAEGAEQPIRWYTVKDEETLSAEVDAFLELMRFDEEKQSFLTEPMVEHMHSTLNCAFENDCLNLAFLEIDGKKAAAYLSFDYLNRLWVYNSGLNPAFSGYSPGWVLLSYLIQWAIDRGYQELDFMRGNESYKYRFGAQDRFVVRATIQR